MEWPGDFPHDHAFMELLVPGVPSEMDYQQLLQDTEEKLHLNGCRWVCRSCRRYTRSYFSIIVQVMVRVVLNIMTMLFLSINESKQNTL